MNNFERIKNMSMNEMMNWLYKITDCEECPASSKDCCFGAGKCEKHIKQWLESEVENE